MTHRGGLLIGIAAWLGLSASATWAVPLDVEACKSLDKERSTLEAAGILTDLHLTANDAKALPKDHFLRVQHYVDVSGQILFRCVPAVKEIVAGAIAPIAPVPAAATGKHKSPAPALNKK